MADEIIVKYQADTKQASKSLDSYIKTTEKVGTTTDKTTKKVETDYSKMSTSVTGSLKSIAGAVGVAFGTQQLLSFGKEAIQLAGKMEGVERAFNKLNRPNLLNNLRTATRGTVSDLELMRQAVRAQNFQVPLEKLASFFEFATKRSIETGESVDYLVSSIIDGIGRKSTLVLDNLGISATQLQEEIKKTGDFGEAAGNIIARSLEETGEVADTTAVKIAQLNVALENTKVAVGEGLIDGFTELGTAIESLGDSFSDASEETDAYAIISDAISTAIELQYSKITAIINLLAQAKGAYDVGSEALQTWFAVITGGQTPLEEFLETQRELSKEAENTKSIAEALSGIVSSMTPTPEAIKNLAYYNQLIKELKTEQADANTTRARVRELEDEINEAMRQRLILLGKLREVGGDELQQIETIGAKQLEVQQSVGDEIIHNQDMLNRALMEAEKLMTSFYDEERDKRINNELDNTRIALDSLSTLYNGFFELISVNSERQRDAELADLQNQLEQGLITREQFTEKERNIRRKEAAQNKDAAIFQATIASLQAVVNALGSYPFSPANIAIAAAVGAAGAAQIAAIASTPLPKFAEGVIDLQGKGTGTSDSIPAMLSKGESVMKATETVRHKKLFNAIRNDRYEEYINDNHVIPIVKSILNGDIDTIGNSLKLNNMFQDRNLLKQGDRNRKAYRDGYLYLGKKIDALASRSNRWN